mmetsp:Transcript_39021/g.125421  ORF Transcript_39021/g.125421 Transcript_39021/m.125421 type:complete len:239 (-) Transcript_39021:132-848(-)
MLRCCCALESSSKLKSTRNHIKRIDAPQKTRPVAQFRSVTLLPSEVSGCNAYRTERIPTTLCNCRRACIEATRVVTAGLSVKIIDTTMQKVTTARLCFENQRDVAMYVALQIIEHMTGYKQQSAARSFWANVQPMRGDKNDRTQYNTAEITNVYWKRLLNWRHVSAIASSSEASMPAFSFSAPSTDDAKPTGEDAASECSLPLLIGANTAARVSQAPHTVASKLSAAWREICTAGSAA